MSSSCKAKWAARRRTPHYHKGNGKDHWSIGSIMFMGPAPGTPGGKDIKGNRVIGATDDKQFLVPVNPKSLAIDKDKGIRVRPEHIHTALREFAGIESHPFSKRYAFDVKDEERLERFWG